MKNNRIASSVAGAVGLFGIVAEPPEEEEEDKEAEERRMDEEGGLMVVYGAKGGKICGFCDAEGVGGEVFGG